MKKLISILLTVALLLSFGLFAIGSSDAEDTSGDQGSGSAAITEIDPTKLGNYNIEIKSCRLAKDYEGKDIVIIKYGYTNNNDTATSFMTAVTTKLFQGGVGLNECYVADESANYSADNQTKDLQKGATLDVEVAYELNDTTTDVVVEVTEWISLNDAKITKTFKLA